MIILDSNPIEAVHALTKIDIAKYYKSLHKTFHEIVKAPKYLFKQNRRYSNYKLYGVKFLCFNQPSFLFYWDFFLELENAVNLIYGEAKLLPRTCSTENIKELVKQLPEATNEQILFAREENILGRNLLPDIRKKPSMDIITYNRILYTLMEHRIDDFFFDIPVWHQIINPTVIEKNSLKEHTSVKITQLHGQYHYFIKDYVGKWQEIKNVPEVFQVFINCLLFK